MEEDLDDRHCMDLEGEALLAPLGCKELLLIPKVPEEDIHSQVGGQNEFGEEVLGDSGEHVLGDFEAEVQDGSEEGGLGGFEVGVLDGSEGEALDGSGEEDNLKTQHWDNWFDGGHSASWEGMIDTGARGRSGGELRDRRCWQLGGLEGLELGGWSWGC